MDRGECHSNLFPTHDLSIDFFSTKYSSSRVLEYRVIVIISLPKSQWNFKGICCLFDERQLILLSNCSTINYFFIRFRFFLGISCFRINCNAFLSAFLFFFLGKCSLDGKNNEHIIIKVSFFLSI
jgi:hypothetical protein